MLKTICTVAWCLVGVSLVQSAGTFDVTKYGGSGDGKVVNTDAIAKAIAAASAASGGTVHFPKGTYLTGPIHLKSNVNLELDDGVVVKFSDKFEDYLPMVPVRKSGLEIHNWSPLIYGWKVSHVTISGKGTFDGSGSKWWSFFNTLRATHDSTGKWDPSQNKYYKDFTTANADLIPHHASLADAEAGFNRPPLLNFVYSDNIIIQDVTFENSPWFTVAPFACENVQIKGVTVKNPTTAPNTDGIHPDSSKNVAISNCVVSTGDDGIVITSSIDGQGSQAKRPSDNITVTGCTVHEAHGGIVIGSGIEGDVRNIHASKLTFQNTNIGIRIKSSPDRGGIVEKIVISDITMKGITHEGITINANYVLDGKVVPEPTAVTSLTPVYRDFQISKVSGDAKLGVEILGLNVKHFDKIVLTDIHITGAAGDMTVKNTDNLTKTNVTVGK